MTSSKAHRAVAAHEGREAAQRHLSTAGGDFYESDDPLGRYLEDLASWCKRRKYSVDGKRCLWCQKANKLKTGSLPHVGALLYCPDCHETYRTLKEHRVVEVVETEPETKVHLADAWGESSCGIGRRTSGSMQQVTCKRCIAYHGTGSVPQAVIAWIKKLR